MRVINRYLSAAVVGLLFCMMSVSAQTAKNKSRSPVATMNSANVDLSLLTASGGEELYAAFGHSAIRMCDTTTGLDWVFNYGLFNFNAPNFYGNFARGRMNYCLGIEPFEHFVEAYAGEGRYLYEQKFRLDSVQTEFMMRFLFDNAREENRHYRYHFFLDNCATRIRDLVAKTYPDIVWPEAHEHPSYRDMVYRCTEEHLWGRFAIDIALGLPTDERTDTWKQMFLPQYMANAFAEARCNGKPITDPPRKIVTPATPLVVKHFPITPLMVCCAVLLLAVMFYFRPRGARIFDFILFLITGLTGFLVCFLWFFTDHTNCLNNLNIIWALPTHTVMAFFMLSRKRPTFVEMYFTVTTIIALILLGAWTFLPQHLNAALIPVVMALAIRSLANSRFRMFTVGRRNRQ